jgi:16S rRNA (cytidine1402-2'-O)-methyltransferase
MNKGKLFVVATPIGNLEDMTFRAVDVLKNVSFILAEDTRETSKLLNRYKIDTQMVSYRDQNHERIIGKVLEKLDLGLDLALVSDAGTPLISDPGYRLVRELRLKNYEVIAIPGASATTSALSVGGLATDRFTFFGFLPKSDVRREKLLKEYLAIESTFVFYESPNRLVKLLKLISKVFGDVMVCVARDMTKMREQYLFGSINEIVANLEQNDFENNPHGEYVVVVENKKD